MKSSKKIFAVVLALSVLCAFLFSVIFIIEESDHDCEGETCRICATLAVCRAVIRAFSVISVIYAVTALSRILCRVISTRRKYENKRTPVTLRVRLLN